MLSSTLTKRAVATLTRRNASSITAVHGCVSSPAPSVENAPRRRTSSNYAPKNVAARPRRRPPTIQPKTRSFGRGSAAERASRDPAQAPDHRLARQPDRRGRHHDERWPVPRVVPQRRVDRHLRGTRPPRGTRGTPARGGGRTSGADARGGDKPPGDRRRVATTPTPLRRRGRGSPPRRWSRSRAMHCRGGGAGRARRRRDGRGRGRARRAAGGATTTARTTPRTTTPVSARRRSRSATAARRTWARA